MKQHVVGVIFARGGSKGVLRKNVRPLAGKPLIAHSIEAAKAAKLVDRVVVSTEDEEIAEVARRYGAEVPFVRPPELAADDSPEWLAWQHALRMLRSEGGRDIDVFVSIPPTAPLREAGDIDSCVTALSAGDADIVVAVTPAHRNPYFNMVVIDDGGFARLVIPPEEAVHRRQTAPVVYDMTTVAYAAKPDFVLAADSLFSGKVKAVVVPPERALDIDTDLDFEIADFMMRRTGSEVSK